MSRISYEISYKILISRDLVMSVFKTINPNTNEQRKQRKSRKLKQRKYLVKRANEIWYADGLDKLKPYGLPIHAAVHVYSCKVLWLKVCKSDNNPIIPACYFNEAGKSLRSAQNLLRTTHSH